MNFTDFSKEARLKEEARINDLTKNVVAKATKMALDKFSKAYGLTTKVAAQKTDLKEFKRNYLSGKIASVLSIDTKDGVKNVPFTILVKASEPSIFESDVIMEDKIANTKGSLESEIDAIIAKQNQKLANYEIEEENNKKIISDLAKGVSLEASRKAHIFKEAKKEVGHNSLSTVTTPTNIFNKVVDYFTYPKTFFPAMKVGAIVDIAGVKYKYIGDEATMTEPAGNTNGTIARFELANKKKASLNKRAGFSNNPDYFGDWYGEGQIDFSKIIDPEAEGDVYMVKLWGGSGYALDVYLVKATDLYEALDKVLEWSYNNEGKNNVVFDREYLEERCKEDYNDEYYYGSQGKSGKPANTEDYESFEEQWMEDWIGNSNYSLFARSENLFVDKVPEKYLK
jgi:hypothetical protein